MQYNYLRNQLKGCVFVKKLIGGENAREGDLIVNFQSLHNVIAVFYKSGIK